MGMSAECLAFPCLWPICTFSGGKYRGWWSCQIFSIEVDVCSQQLDVEGLLLALMRQG